MDHQTQRFVLLGDSAMQSTPAVTTFETRSGLKLDIRLAEESDEALIRQMFKTVPQGDQQFRFISVPDGDWSRRDASNRQRIESFIAFAGDQLAAMATLARDTSLEKAEVLNGIHEEWKGHGIGCTMLEYAILAARQRDVKILWAIEEHANPSGMKASLGLGFTAIPIEGDPSIVQLEMRF
jgi:acetyltransferase